LGGVFNFEEDFSEGEFMNVSDVQRKESVINMRGGTLKNYELVSDNIREPLWKLIIFIENNAFLVSFKELFYTRRIRDSFKCLRFLEIVSLN
jgi:hypothetical protein